jgi:DNA primase
MAHLIPQNFITDLLTRVDIVEIINPRVNLRKAGSNYQALCPFHNEKTPSFSVSQRKQFYHCFGCGASGNAISFLMNFDKLTFLEAVEALAAHAGIEVPKNADGNNSAAQTQTQFNELYTLLEKVNDFYQQQLCKNQPAVEYLKNRGISLAVCNHFKIGYAPATWEHLNHFHLTNTQQQSSCPHAQPHENNHPDTATIARPQPSHTQHQHHNTIAQQLIATGMLSHKEERLYARFRNRIMFPIRDRRGRIVGFGGRAISSNDNPKYLNSPETVIFHKGNELYGLFEARQSNRVLNQIIVVEGYMDVVALAQHGITNAVATLGTAITPRQTQHILQNCDTIFFCFDGDNAGRSAAWRALENILPLMREGIEARFLFLPEHEDPDSMIRKEGTAAFIRRLTKAIPLSDFLFQQLSSKTNINTLDGRAKLIKETLELLQKMAHGVFKQMLLSKLAEITKTDINTILNANIDGADLRQHITSPLTLTAAAPMPPPYANDHSNMMATANANMRRNNHVSATSQRYNKIPSRLLEPSHMAIGLLLNYPELNEALTDKVINIITKLNTLETNLLIQLNTLVKEMQQNTENNDLQQNPANSTFLTRQNLTLGTILEYWRQRPEEEFTLISKIAAWQPIIPHDALKNEFNGIIRKICEQGLEHVINSLLQQASSNGLNDDEKNQLQNLIKLVKKIQNNT